MDWRYNPDTKQWESSRNGWRGVVARWVSGDEWIAAIEPLGTTQARRMAPYVFRWMEDAQAWCAAEIARHGQLPEAAK